MLFVSRFDLSDRDQFFDSKTRNSIVSISCSRGHVLTPYSHVVLLNAVWSVALRFNVSLDEALFSVHSFHVYTQFSK